MFQQLILISLLFFSSEFPITARAGQDGNGGDPRVVEFLASTQVVCAWMKQNVVLSSYSDKCWMELKALTNSVNLDTTAARISSTSDDVKDDNGISKDAVTDLTTRTISINIDRWKNETPLEHGATAAMEISILIGVPNRYEVAQMFLMDNAKNTTKAPAPADDCSTVEEAMASLIYSYISALKSCYALEQSGQANRSSYQQQVAMAKTIEAAYARDAQVCNQVCESKIGCNGPAPSGACQKR